MVVRCRAVTNTGVLGGPRFCEATLRKGYALQRARDTVAAHEGDV
jgi:hypothetical protein